jgi:hypothetical protein
MYHRKKIYRRVTVHKRLLVGAYANLLILELVSIHSQHFIVLKFLHANIFIVNTKPFYMKYTFKTSTISTFYLFYGLLKGEGGHPSTGRRNARNITFRDVPHLYILLLILYQQIKGTLAFCNAYMQIN